MDFEKICQKIDKNESLTIHNYYQKILALLFLNKKDPFNRKLIKIDVEKKIGNGLSDLFLTWEYDKKRFTEIIEVHLQPKKRFFKIKLKFILKRLIFFLFVYLQKS